MNGILTLVRTRGGGVGVEEKGGGCHSSEIFVNAS